MRGRIAGERIALVRRVELGDDPAPYTRAPAFSARAVAGISELDSEDPVPASLLRSFAILTVLALAASGCDDSRSSDDASVDTDAGMQVPVDGATPADGGTPGRDAQVMPTSPLVDPDCTDGMYSEALPDSSADIGDLVAAYDASMVDEFVLAVLTRRYGVGHSLVSGGLAARDCVRMFLSDTSTAQAVVEGLTTVVHECGHILDNSRSSGNRNAYVITDTLTLTCAQGDSTDRGGLTFARSRIQGDEYASLRPACGGTFRPGCDFYADIYLDGDPDDGRFDSGDQGFNMLFDEIVQYVNSLATGLAFSGELGAGGRSVSERDGILNFLWYLERYLRMARTDFPTAYAHLLNGDGGCWRNAILTLWGRAWLYLEATSSMSQLGIDDDALMTLVTDADLLAEIQRLRDAAGCPAP